jgi:hypothetical protein
MVEIDRDWIAYKGDDCVELRLHALVDFDSVDWSETVVLNAVDRYTVGEESEIRLKDDAFLELVSVENLETDRIVLDNSRAPERLPAGELAFCQMERRRGVAA